MRAVVIVSVLAVAIPARADAPALHPVVSSMVGVDGEPCGWLLSDIKDGCKRVAKQAELGFDAEVFQAGTRRGIRRLVLVVTSGDQRMASPGVDLLGEDCSDAPCITLDTAIPTVRPVQIDGRSGVVLDIVSTFTRGTKSDRFQTESVVGCAPTAAGPWKCSTIDVGACTATVGVDGTLETSCGAHASLSVDAHPPIALSGPR
jgi:hypothetical protein